MSCERRKIRWWINISYIFNILFEAGISASLGYVKFGATSHALSKTPENVNKSLLFIDIMF